MGTFPVNWRARPPLIKIGCKESEMENDKKGPQEQKEREQNKGEMKI